MLTSKQIEEIKEHLEKAQNPVFFFDNDQDGLCSFLLLQRFIGRGKGVAIKSFPELDESNFRRVKELNADYIFILDKPLVSAEFFEEVAKINLPVVWIDHHEVDLGKLPEFVSYYYSEEPTTFLAWQVTEKKDDLWLGVAGCIADKFVPSFYPEFKKQYPELAIESEEAFEIFYKSDIGKVSRLFGHGLKDRTTNVVKMLRFLMEAKSPHEVLEESKKNYLMYRRFDEIEKHIKKLIEKASAAIEGDLLFFEYGGSLSVSSDLSNELSFKFPDKLVVVAYLSGTKVNISARGKNVRKRVLKAIEGLERATGGGHECAVGAVVQKKDLEEFKTRLQKNI